MESINLDLESESHKNIDISLNSKPSTQGINLQKSDTGSSLGLDLLINKKKVSSDGIKSINVNNLNNSTPSSPSKNTSLNLDSELGINTLNLDKPDEGIVNLDSLLSDNSSNNLNYNKSKDTLNDLSLDDLDLNLDSLDDIKSEPTMNINNEIRTPELSQTERPKTYEEIQKDKFELLCQLERLEAKGVKLEKRYDMNSDYAEMKHDFDRYSSRRELDQSIRFQQKMLVAGVTAVEFLNNRFDPADIKLDGWSESIHEGIHDYDDVFEELHEKYKGKSKTPPEVRLLMMLGGSAFMFHLTNTMFKSSLPGVGDIMKQNPDLMQQFAKATMNSMGPQEPGFSNIMNDMINTQGGSRQSQPAPPRRSAGPSRPEMKAPPDLDSILSELSPGNSKQVDITSDLSDSETDSIRNISIGKNNKREINLEI
jgi:hypothetical protein